VDMLMRSPETLLQKKSAASDAHGKEGLV